MSTLEKVLLYTSTIITVVVAIAMIMIWSQMNGVRSHLREQNEWVTPFSSEWRPWVNVKINELWDAAGLPGDPDPPIVPDPPPEYEG